MSKENQARKTKGEVREVSFGAVLADGRYSGGGGGAINPKTTKAWSLIKSNQIFLFFPKYPIQCPLHYM
jgi:hypothetical protein